MRRCAPLALAPLLAGCMLGPNYHRPAVDIPGNYRGATAEGVSLASLGADRWSEVFHDPVLQQLIRTALRENYDVRIAATRVLQAQAQLGITRSNEFPTLYAGAEAFTERNPKISALFPAYDAHAMQVGLSAIWNLDFWGKYRRQTEAARANWLASEWGQRAVLDTVVASVASTYFQIRELDLALQISRDTLTSRQSSLHLTQVLAQNGSASLLDVRQSEQLVYTAAESIPQLEAQLAQQEDLLSTLLGGNPTDIPRGLALTAEATPANVPAGLPSQLLERRPDIRQAEESLVAANAEIGAAKAALFPSISLTGAIGFESYQLQNVLSAGSRTWNATGTLTQPDLPSWRAARRSSAHARAAAGGAADLQANHHQRLPPNIRCACGLPQGARISRATAGAYLRSRGYGPAVECALSARRRQLPAGAHRRDQLLLGTTQSRTGGAQRTARAGPALQRPRKADGGSEAVTARVVFMMTKRTMRS